MSNKELVETAKQVIDDLGGLHGTKTACDCLRLFCERIEQTKNLVVIMQKLEMYVTESELRKQEGVLITNKQALDIVKYTPTYID
jgi:hypothetical protein